MQSIKHDVVEAAYLFYYATDVALQEGAEEDGRVKKRLNELIGDALIIAGLVCVSSSASCCSSLLRQYLGWI